MVLAPNRFVVVMALVAGLGCDRRQTAPSPLGDPGGAVAGVTGVSISSFTVGGWHAGGKFNYVPRVSVTADPGAGPFDITEVSFIRSDDWSEQQLASVRYDIRPRLAAGATLSLVTDSGSSPSAEMTSPTMIGSVTVVVSYVNGAGRTGQASSDVPVPALVTDASAAVLAIKTFTVEGSVNGLQLIYVPKLTLEETGGTSDATVMRMLFQLLDVGPEGNVPVFREGMLVPKGQTLVLDANVYGPWLEITSTTAYTNRVSVVIDYVDSSGRGGSASAVADVVR